MRFADVCNFTWRCSRGFFFWPPACMGPERRQNLATQGSWRRIRVEPSGLYPIPLCQNFPKVILCTSPPVRSLTRHGKRTQNDGQTVHKMAPKGTQNGQPKMVHKMVNKKIHKNGQPKCSAGQMTLRLWILRGGRGNGAVANKP